MSKFGWRFLSIVAWMLSWSGDAILRFLLIAMESSSADIGSLYERFCCSEEGSKDIGELSDSCLCKRKGLSY